MAAKKKPSDDGESLPRIGAPATRALNGAGYTTLKQLTKATEAELMALHGFGPKALGILKDALKEQGLAFARDDGKKTRKP